MGSPIGWGTQGCGVVFLKNIHVRRQSLVRALLLLFIITGLIFSLSPKKTLLKEVDFSNAYFSKEGELLKIYPSQDGQYRQYTHISDFPQDFLEAIMLQEDQHFYYHMGVNHFALYRAFYETYIARDRRVGGSTITMQLARMLYKIDTSSLQGKLLQILKALHLELFYSKQAIFEAYLNLAPCGGNIQGFPAASLLFYERSLSELTMGEWMLLCVLPQNPLNRDPRYDENRDTVLEARNLLYERWIDKYPQSEDIIYHTNLLPRVSGNQTLGAPHLTDQLQMNNRYYGSLITTLNMDLQIDLNQKLKGYVGRLSDKGVSNGAALILDYTTMELVAAVGSAGYFDRSILGMVNGFSSRRSPGSTLKPFIYALAIDQGLIHPKTILYDRPISFGTYSPDNYQRGFKGPVPAWDALVNSRNLPAVELASNLKSPDLYDLLNEAPVGSMKHRDHYGLSLVLGGAEFSMLELAGLYATLGNGGVLKDIMVSDQVVLQDYREQRLFSSQSAAITRAMLERNPPPNGGFSPLFNELSSVEKPQIGYKTGTSIGFKDGWSIGLYGQYVIAVWIGNFDGEGNPIFLGRETATPLLYEIGTSLESSLIREERVDRNRGISLVPVCTVSGNLPTEYCSQTRFTPFIPGVSPITKCDIHRPILIDDESGFRVDRETENTHWAIREIWPTDMLTLFKEAGIPRPVPPPYENSYDRSLTGREQQAPRILSPLKEATYIFRPEEDKYGKIPLMGAVDGEVREIFWFANGHILGKSPPQETLYWSPDPGIYNLILLDDRGFSTDREVVITMEP